MTDAPPPNPAQSPWAMRERKNFDGSRRWMGIGISVIYISLSVVFAVARWDDFKTLTPNELGDFLAGVFAPLAFLWLVLGFFQQGDELRQSSDALWLQGQELQNSGEQQRDLVNVTREQLAFERERLDHEANELWRQAQPDLIILISGHAGGERGGRKMLLRLLNRGAACTDLTLTRGDELIQRMPMCATGAEFSFNIQVDLDEPIGPMNFLASFRDARGHKQSLKITLDVVQQGAVRVLRAVG